MSRCFILFFLLGLGAAVSRGAELGFLSPDFRDASSETLAKRIEDAPTDSLPQTLSRLFLADFEQARGAIHAASAQIAALSETCQRWEKDDYRSVADLGVGAMICALAETELASGGGLSRWWHGEALRRARERAFAAQATPENRRYFEGRLFAALPPSLGQDFKKSLLALRFLQTTQAEDGSVRYWLARAFERQGNAATAREMYREAAARRFPPAVAVVERSEYARESDGRSYGVRLGIFQSPASGFGGAVEWRDDRLFDSARSARLGGWVSTRGQYAASLKYGEESWLAPAVLDVEGSYRYGAEDYFAPGSSAVSTFDSRRFFAQLSATTPIAGAFSMSVGWRVSQASAVAPVSFGKASGAIAALVYDERDSFADPASGWRAEASAFFPSSGLGSDSTFRRWRVAGEAHYPWSLRHGLHLRVAGVFFDGETIFSEYPDLAREVSGVREFRYRDRNLLGGTLEHQWRFAAPASVAAFFSLATISAESNLLLSSRAKAGGGLSWIGHLSRYRSMNPRIDVAYFGSEWVVQGAVQAAF